MLKPRYLELCFITNNPILAQELVTSGIDRIMVDLEHLGKIERQRGRGLFLSNHNWKDVAAVAAALPAGRLQVRINPPHKNTHNEIETALENGAHIIMLPMYRSTEEVQLLVNTINKRAQVCLLLENRNALECLNETLYIAGIDEIYIGLNDLALSLGNDCIFEVLRTNILEQAASQILTANIKFGFGGVTTPDQSKLPVNPSWIIEQQARLGSTIAILGRSFRERFTIPGCGIAVAKAVQQIRAHYERAALCHTVCNYLAYTK